MSKSLDPKDPATLTRTELDAAVAEEVMGWHVRPRQEPREIGSASLYFGRADAECWEDDEGGRYDPVDEWHPSEDIAAAWEVQQHIENLDRDDPRYAALYAFRLNQACGGHPDSFEEVWKLITATPRQRCEAALQCVRALASVRGGKDDKDHA